MPTQVLVVADLTDPMLAPAEANGVFQVMLEQFRKKELPCGKLAVFDEAHKYLEGGDGLAHSIVDTVRLMRHEGIRVVVSTQSPLTMPPELLESQKGAQFSDSATQRLPRRLSARLSVDHTVTGRH